jgi:Zn finger protein HypA/HybF involved in hydrogenase expression
MTPGHGLTMIERLQRAPVKTEPLKFPKADKPTKCDRQCRDCETVYYKTTRTYCPHCESYTVWPIVEGVEA